MRGGVKIALLRLCRLMKPTYTVPSCSTLTRVLCAPLCSSIRQTAARRHHVEARRLVGNSAGDHRTGSPAFRAGLFHSTLVAVGQLFVEIMGAKPAEEGPRI